MKTPVIERLVAKNDHFVGPWNELVIQKGRSYVVSDRIKESGKVCVRTPTGGWFGWVLETEF